MNSQHLLQKEDLLASIISSLDKYTEPADILENINEGVNFLALYPEEDVENLIKRILMTVPQILNKIYHVNDTIIQSGGKEISHTIRDNFQITLGFINILIQILDHISQLESVTVVFITTVSVNMGQAILLTFEHCKNRQRKYNSELKSVTEILDLFRRAQELHSKYLHFLDESVNFTFLSENQIAIFEELLDIILKISGALSGINIKSMADNWKGFITLVQKYSSKLPKSYDISTAVNSLTAEVEKNMQTVCELGNCDIKKSTQILKINGFLIKVALKLFESEPNIFENCDDVFKFYFMIFSWHCGIFHTHGLPLEFIDAIDAILHQNTEPFMNQLFSKNTFIKKLCLLEKERVFRNNRFGFLCFSNEFFKKLPQILKDKPEALKDTKIVSLLNLIFVCSQSCFKEFFFDYDSVLYEDLVTNISVIILIFPHNYAQIEELLLDCLIQEEIWTATMATDIWCTVLRHSPVSTSISTIHMLIRKIQELNLGIFIQSPAIVHMKMLAQRIFKQLPVNVRNEEVSKYGPTENLSVWKILNLENISLSQRFHVEFILSDFLDKVDNIEKEYFALNDVLLLMENMEAISSVKFENLELNTSRLVVSIVRLWSLSLHEFSPSNLFFKYFMYILTKLTLSLMRHFTGEQILLILHQLKQVVRESVCQLLACDILQALGSRNFDNFQDKLTLFSVMSSLFEVMWANRNLVVTQRSLVVFQDVSKSQSYETAINRTLTNSPLAKKLITEFKHRDVADVKSYSQYLDKLAAVKFQHQCLEWTDSSLPQRKKLKVDDASDLEDIITTLKSSTQKLYKETTRVPLNSGQVSDIKRLIQKLEMLLTNNC